MKKLVLTLITALALSSCGSNETANEGEITIPPVTDEVAAKDPNAIIDPVCEMEKDSTWTEYSVSGTDTTWFCSETCKTTYEGNPAKYKKS